MTAEALLTYASEVGFLIIFLVVLARAIRQPTRANTFAAVFFGLAVALVTLDWLQGLTETQGPAVDGLRAALVLIWPYPLLRLADEFTGVNRFALRASEAGLVASVASVAAVLALGGDVGDSGPLALVMAVYFVGTVVYASARFVRGAQTRHGLPRRRLVAAAAGSGLLGLLVLFAIPAGIQPEGPWSGMATVSGLGAGLSYLLAFAPSPGLRRAWLSIDLQEFVVEAILAAPQDPSRLDELARRLETRVTYILGAPAYVLMPDPETGGLVAPAHAEANRGAPFSVAERCYDSQRPLFVNREDAPPHKEGRRKARAGAILAAPVTLAEERFGVLTLVAERTPMFAEGDLQILQVLADQVGVILRHRQLLEDAAEAQAQQEALRLKEDFLSAAAHDLKTPLTTLLAQSQLMQRFAARDPEAPADREGIERLVTEAHRMRRLVSDLLDASRDDQTGFVGATRPVDLVLLAQETVQTMGRRAERVVLEGDPCVLQVDRDRVAQVLENLLDNALKYSPDGGTVRVVIQSDGAGAQFSVTDSGVGIPHDDLAQIFNRFQRGASVDERRFSGLGLGLYLCKRIVEEHGGTISVTSAPGQGSTFTVSLPRGSGGETS
ncbi:MAG: GAF domain-containing sensor histidine kinase [Dehalococcoidia bacterium]|nr:GAF domain-containing sensor histidine kinase [Dehalococcoidia bacterium]